MQYLLKALVCGFILLSGTAWSTESLQGPPCAAVSLERIAQNAPVIDAVLAHHQTLENATARDFLLALRDALHREVMAQTQADCAAGCNIGQTRQAVQNHLVETSAKIQTRWERIKGTIARYAPSRRLSVSFALFLSGSVGVTVMNMSVLGLVERYAPGLVESIKPLLNTFTGVIFGATTFLTVDALNNRARAAAATLAGTSEPGTEVRIDPEIYSGAVNLSVKGAGLDGRVGGIYGAWNGYSANVSSALISARLAGEGGDNASAYNTLAGVALMARKTQLQIDPSVTLPFTQFAPIIASFAQARLPQIYPEVLARLIAIHKVEFNGREPTRAEIDNFYRPFLRTLFEPSFTPNQGEIDQILRDNPDLFTPPAA